MILSSWRNEGWIVALAIGNKDTECNAMQCKHSRCRAKLKQRQQENRKVVWRCELVEEGAHIEQTASSLWSGIRAKELLWTGKEPGWRYTLASAGS